MKKISSNLYEVEAVDVREILKPRQSDSNKGTYKTVGIMGGSLEYSGSVKLANMSAVATKGGCGVVKLIIDRELATIIAPFLLEQTIYPLDYDEEMNLSDTQFQNIINTNAALAIGMGWNNDKLLGLLVKIINNYKGNLILDATALNLLSKIDLNILKDSQANIVLTPHIKEFSRLIKLPVETIKANKEKLACEFARKYNVVLLLKDNQTLVTDCMVTYIIKVGSPGMATAGSGDVLDGLLVSILGYNKLTPLVVSTASYVAGLAGSLASKKYTDIAMTASNTIEFIPEAIKNIRKNIL